MATEKDLKLIATANKIAEGWITEDRWLKYGYFGKRYAKSREKITPKRIGRLFDLGLITFVEQVGNYAYYKAN